MRAKRSKKYQKLMRQYELTFGFRAPYQVLVDSHFLQSVYNFKMDLVPALERTVQGKVKPSAIMASQSLRKDTDHAQRQLRPPQLPPPTTLPLRYCSHNEDSTPVDEEECLLSLLSPNPDAKKNKEHFILATADPAPETTTQPDQKRKLPHWMQAQEGLQQQQQRGQRYNLRRDARQIPGVPIIYVKRSVMILEPMSEPSSHIREGFEEGKLRSGFIEPATITGKRKRGAEGEDEEDEDGGEWVEVKKKKKVKGVNPLSMKKPKQRTQTVQKPKKADENTAKGDNDIDKGTDGASEQSKPKRKRRHKKKAEQIDGAEKEIDTPIADTGI
ncbi:rRNA processing protein [Trichophyton rubrum]|uniref:rRNA processing protein n=1 Tax=Trichophyton rubrum TaxID=5551 RepID=A0A178EZX8_TRIRU|nr:rRNA processing protein [Trichophyton rubrum]